jgi:hypothetical protein
MRVEEDRVAVLIELAVDLPENSSEAWTTITGQLTMEDQDGIVIDVWEEPVADCVRSVSVQGSAHMTIFVLVIVAAIDYVQIGEV